MGFYIYTAIIEPRLVSYKRTIRRLHCIVFSMANFFVSLNLREKDLYSVKILFFGKKITKYSERIKNCYAIVEIRSGSDHVDLSILAVAN